LSHLLIEVIGVNSIDYQDHHPAYLFPLIGLETVLQPGQGGGVVMVMFGDRTEATAKPLAELLRVRIHQSETLVELLGPAPADILRVAQHYRWQILLKLPPNPKTKTASFELPVAELRALCPSSIRFSIDVDPLTLL
jgi:primosomal protein N' (replication factor Y) (superfamily II helicase)